MREQLVQERPDVVDHARMIPRELLECEQRRAAHGRAVVFEPASQELNLGPEAKLPDRAIRDGALSEIRGACRGLELLVPLRPQLRELALLPVLRELVGLGCSVCERHQPCGYARRGSPT